MITDSEATAICATLGERIREEMAWQSVKPAGLARAIGMEPRRLRRRLAHPELLDVGDIALIARVLGVCPSALWPRG